MKFKNDQCNFLFHLGHLLFKGEEEVGCEALSSFLRLQRISTILDSQILDEASRLLLPCCFNTAQHSGLKSQKCFESLESTTSYVPQSKRKKAARGPLNGVSFVTARLIWYFNENYYEPSL